MIKGVILIFLSKLDLLGILEDTCLGSTNGSYRRAVFLGWGQNNGYFL